MTRYLTLTLAASTWLAATPGCSDEQFVAAIYDSCRDLNDCVPSADRCEELTIDFAGGAFSNNICTVTCETLGELSPDCPRAQVTARFGSCYPADAAGGDNSTPVCFEPCDNDGDCLFGFKCLNDQDLCVPGQEPCAITPGDAICVPGP